MTKPDSGSRSCLGALCCVLGTFGLAGAGAATVLLLTEQDGVLSAVPLALLIGAAAGSGLCFLVAVLGCGVAFSRGPRRRLGCAFSIAALLMTLAVGLVAVFLLLRSGMVSTIEPLDELLSNAKTEMELSLVDQASGDPEAWVVTQDDLGCCGVGLEETFEGLGPWGNQTEVLDLQITGKERKCETTHTKIKELHEDAAGDFGPEAEAAAKEAFGENFFCKDKLRMEMQRFIFYAGIVAATMGLLYAMAFVAAVLIQFRQEEEDTRRKTGSFAWIKAAQRRVQDSAETFEVSAPRHRNAVMPDFEQLPTFVSRRQQDPMDIMPPSPPAMPPRRATMAPPSSPLSSSSSSPSLPPPPPPGDM